MRAYPFLKDRTLCSVVLLAAFAAVASAGHGSRFHHPGAWTGRATQHPSAKDFTLIDIVVTDANGNTIDRVYPWDINSSGVVGGYYFEQQGSQVVAGTFVWSRGQVRKYVYPDPAQNYTSVSAVPDSERFLFGNWGTLTTQHAGYYLVRENRWVQLPDISGYPLNFGAHMLDSGLATGYACRVGDFNQAADCVSWTIDVDLNREHHLTESDYRKISFPVVNNGVAQPDWTTLAYGLNHKGQIVGIHFGPSFDFQGFTGDVRDTRHLKPFSIQYNGDTLPAALYSITDNGTILGSAPIAPNGFSWTPFLFERGNVTLLPSYDKDERAYGTFYAPVNNRGDAVGFWYDQTFQIVHTFVALRIDSSHP